MQKETNLSRTVSNGCSRFPFFFVQFGDPSQYTTVYKEKKEKNATFIGVCSHRRPSFPARVRFSLPVLQRGLAKTKIRKTHFCRKPISPPGLEALKENPPKKKTMIGSHFLPFFGAGLGEENVLGQNSDAQVGPSLQNLGDESATP